MKQSQKSIDEGASLSDHRFISESKDKTIRISVT